MRRARVQQGLGLATAAVFTLVAGCGGAGESTATEPQPLDVFAAASLTEVFPKIDSAPRYNFAGSNALAQQIRHGAPADVFAAASARDPQGLYGEGLCEEPVPFASNQLVVIVPEANRAGVATVRDLERPGLRLVLAAEGIPVGDYTRAILDNLGNREAVLANVVSNEPDVKSVVGKVALGEADAGIVYRTDVLAVEAEVSQIEFPDESQPLVTYELCIVADSDRPEAAQAFVDRVLGPGGRERLTEARFGLPE